MSFKTGVFDSRERLLDVERLLQRHSFRTQGLAEILLASEAGQQAFDRVQAAESAHDLARAEQKAAGEELAAAPKGKIVFAGRSYDSVDCDLARLPAADAAEKTADHERFDAHQAFVQTARSEEAFLSNARRAARCCTRCGKAFRRFIPLLSDTVCWRCSDGGVR